MKDLCEKSMAQKYGSEFIDTQNLKFIADNDQFVTNLFR